MADDPLIVIRGDLKQKDVRNFDLELIRVPHDYSVARGSSSHHEAALRAAIAADWIEQPECKVEMLQEQNGQSASRYYFDGELIEDMDPRDCYAAGEVVLQLYGEFTNLDPTSSRLPPTPARAET